MAIDLKKIHAEKSNPELSAAEKEFVSKLEAYTDEVISKEYGDSPDYSIILDSEQIDKILKPLPYIRTKPVQAAWVELYKNHNWELKAVSKKEAERLEKITGRKTKIKKGNGEDAVWLIKPINVEGV